MNYHDSLWKDAPEGATHWALTEIGTEDGPSTMVPVFVKPHERWPEDFAWYSERYGWMAFRRRLDQLTDLHPRPVAFQSAAQLIEAYRKDHAAEIEADVQAFLNSLDGEMVEHRLMKLNHLLDDALFHITLIERHLAAERARIEEVGK